MQICRQCLQSRSFASAAAKATKQYLQRHSNDAFVKQAVLQDFRSRAAFKLQSILKDYPSLLTPSQGSSAVKILDLGSSPGGWSQAAQRATRNAKIVAVDIIPMDPIDGVTFIHGDMTQPEIMEMMKYALDGQCDLLVSDMAHSFTGNKFKDVTNVIDLCRLAERTARSLLRPGGGFVCKYFDGTGVDELRALLSVRFEKVIYDKPAASKSGSAEGYLIGLRHRGGKVVDWEKYAEQLRRIRKEDAARSQPHWRQLIPGTIVMASIPDEKSLVKGVVEMVLSRDYHPLGVRVRLTDGRLGRATYLATGKGDDE